MTGQQLKYEIKRRGYTLRQLARLVGTPPQNLSRKLMSDDVPTSLLEGAAAMMAVSPAEFYGAGDTIQATASQAVAFKGTQNIATDPRLLDVIQQQQTAISTLQRQQQTVIDTLQRQQQVVTDLLRQSAFYISDVPYAKVGRKWDDKIKIQEKNIPGSISATI